MEQCHSTFEIRPGESIGPLRLGMTREQVRELAQRDLGGDIEARKYTKLRTNAEDEYDCDVIRDTGLSVNYDGHGRVNRVDACWGPARFACKTPDPDLMLFGKDVSRMNDAEVLELCQSHWSDVSDRHFSIDVPSAGLSFTYFENRTDGTLCGVEVFPPQVVE